MKTTDICSKHQFDQYEFDLYVTKNYQYKQGFSGITINDEDVDKAISEFKIIAEEAAARKAEEERIAREQYMIENADAIREENARIERERAKEKALAEMLITSGFSFDGYKIVKYSGYISGDDAIQVNREVALLGGVSKGSNLGNALTDALVKIRRQALKELKEAAYNLGCNAVIGVDFDYITLEPETTSLIGSNTTYLPYVFCVTANGNAVILEKVEE